MARVTFETIFQKNPNGTISPRQTVRIGGITLSPGVSLSKGVAIGGVDISQFENHDLEITTDNGIIVIVGIY